MLTGRYVATCFNNRSAPEWPPHPARLFSALVATAHEHEELTEPARIALQWLERQGAPHIEASAAETRSLIASYVPGNEGGVVGGWQAAEEKLDEALAELAQAEASGDAKAKKSAQRHVDKARKKFEADLGTALVDDGKGNALDAQRQLPDKRGRQARLMPALTPHVPCVRYAWPHADPSTEVVVQLKELSRRLVRLGHSSSFVSCRVLDEVATLQSPSYRSSARPGSGLQHWRPTSSSGVSMRIVDSGQLRRLESAFERHGGFEPRILPYAYQSYEIEGAEGTYTPAASAYGEWIVLREVAGESGRRLGLKLSKTEDITRALRGALLIHSEGAIPPVISGHDSSGKPLERPHVAYVPLADVGSEYSSGNVLGVAVLLPRSIDQAERRAVLRAIGRWEQAGLRLTLGRVGALELERVVDIDPRKTLDPKWWTLPARRWGSVTPVALD
ncbi:MAG TPA: type I-U CRISPR-associated protein Csb2, partial [Polyangiaceae bacterium]|nr:type I-U CRISPR-associated protein Csb2 [Polyangiaceae bacterium]